MGAGGMGSAIQHLNSLARDQLAVPLASVRRVQHWPFPRGAFFAGRTIQETLSYNPETGIFVWLVGRRAGLRAGTFRKGDGYRYINLGSNVVCAEHRIAWLMTHGVWPTHQIDHINRNKTDNRLANLREASHSQQQMNAPRSKRNKSGCRGVWLPKSENKWRACITVAGKNHWLGTFDRYEDAVLARRQAEIKYFGEFARE